MVALAVEPVLNADELELQEWMNAQLSITLSPVAQGGTMQAVPHTQGPAGPTATNLGASIGRSIIAVVQTLTRAATAGGGGGAAGGEGATKEKYSQDEVAALLGFAKLDTAHKLPQFWKRIQASKKSRGGVMDMYCNIILKDIKKWAWDDRRDIDKGVHLKKKTINSIISFCFNPGGCAAQYTTAGQGISILAFWARSTQEIETFKVQELTEERSVATRSYKEVLKIAKTMVCAPALTCQDMKLNISTFCAFLWTLFRDGCNYFVEILKVLRILESEDVHAMCKAYTPEVCRRIIWAILHKGRHFFDKILLSTAFTSGRMVEYPICLLIILDKVHNADIIQSLTYPLAWVNDAEPSQQGHLPGPQNVPPPTSWTLPATPVQAGAKPMQQILAAASNETKEGTVLTHVLRH